MISIHGTREGDVGGRGHRWINLVDPGPEDVRRLLTLEALDESFIGHALDQHECLKEISAEIQELEHDLADTRSNEDLKLLLNLQKSVTYFHSALKTNDFIIDRIIRKGLNVGKCGKLCFTEEEEDGLDYALTETRQGIYMAKIFNEVLTSIANVYSSIISNSVNQIMKVLTSMTVIIMIPTFITSLYGMNVELPFQHDPTAFAIVAAMGAALTAGVICVMKLRRIL